MGSFVLALHDAGGTVPPMVAIAQALLGRGHDVTVLAQPSVERPALEAGAAFRAFAVGDYDHDVPIEEQLDTAGELITGRGPGDELLDVIEAVGADAVVVDANLAGVAAAAEVAPCRSTILFHSLYATYVDVWFGELWPLLGPLVAETRAAYGLEPAGSWADVFRPHDRRYAVVPEVFDVPGHPDGTPPIQHPGFLLPATGALEPPGLERTHGQLVLISLSTTDMGQAPLLQTILDAVAELPVDALLTAGRQRLAPGLRVPANVEVVGHVPHAAVLPEVDVVVTHAGLGTVAAALDHGVPLVCTPIARDQPLNASRVTELRAGRAVPAEHATPDLVRQAIAEVLADPSYRRAAEQVAEASRAAGGADAVAADLEVVARQALSPRARPPGVRGCR